MSASATMLVRCVTVVLSLASLAIPAWGQQPGTFSLALLSVGQFSRSAEAREQCDELLAQGRRALENGNYAQAQHCLQQAEQLNVSYDSLFSHFSDTPEKLRRDLNEATGQQSGAATPSSRFLPTGRQPEASSAPSDPFQVAAPAQTTEQALDTMTSGAKAQAQRLLEDGRRALATGNKTQAIACYQRALATGVQFAPGEYTPQHLAAEMQQAGIDLSTLTAGPARPRELAPDELPASPGETLAERIVGGDTQPRSARDGQYSTPAAEQAGGAYPQLARAPQASTGSFDAEQARLRSRALLLGARRALAMGAPDDARGQLAEVRSLGVSFGFDEDSPERVEALLTQWNQIATLAQQPPSAQSQRMQSDFLMEQARWLLHYGDKNAARQLAQHAANLQAQYSQFEATPQQFLDSLSQAAGQAVDQVTATADTANEAARQQVLGLLAQARQAMDQGNEALAEQFLAQAEAIRPAGDNAAGSQPLAAPQSEYSRPVAQASASAPITSGQTYPVSQGLYVPDQDATHVAAAAAQLPDRRPEPTLAGEAQAPRSAPGAADPYALVSQGEEALQNGDVATARKLFQQAFQYQAQLDPAVRERLQHYLQDLPVPGEIVPTGPEVASPLQQLDAEQQYLFRQLQSEVSQVRNAVERRRESDPLGALKQLTELRGRIAQSNLESNSRGMLLHSVDTSIAQLNRYIDDHRPEIELDESNREVLAQIDLERQRQAELELMLADLVEQFNQLSQEQRFEEAVQVAKAAHELDPENPVTELLLTKGQMAMRVDEWDRIRAAQESGNVGAWIDVATAAIPFNDEIAFPKDWLDISGRRLRRGDDATYRMSPTERALTEALEKPVPVSFQNVPLSQAIDALAARVGVNIHIDPRGLAAEGVGSNDPVSINIAEPISLRSVLNLILAPKRLGFVIQDEVLLITSEQARDVKIQTQVYKVADLVIPIPNFSPSYDMGISSALRSAVETANLSQIGFQGTTAALLAQQGGGNVPAGSLANFGQPGFGDGFAAGPGGMGGAAEADFDSLIELITSTIAPTTWDEVGGVGSIAGFDTNLSLVVSQTQEVHEQIVDLLEQLRRLQDLQVTIEVRFIRLRDQFFERIGVDFDFRIDSGIPNMTRAEFLSLPDPPSATLGAELGEAGTQLTADLAIPFTQNTFASAVPQFGGFNPQSGAQFGFAILSDIEAFFLVQAAQGDARDNILQAPKVTLFNGQQATVSDTTQQSFVTGLIPVVGDFAAIHQPVIVVLSQGMQLSVQAVVSPDRRFVRLTLVPFFSQIGDVNQFTFQGKTSTDSGTTELDPADPTMTVVDNSTSETEGTTVQLPEFAFTTVTTTVSVPDGGTILLGGIKRLSENRGESGVPIFSKMPYINRLFRNVGIGKTTESLMMMVTPRIIIQEEEEELLF